MNKVTQRTTKVLDSPVSLGRSRIDADSLTVGGAALPDAMMLNAERGTIQWTDQQSLGPKGPYLFEFTYFTPAEVNVTADKAQIAADGVEQTTLMVTSEDTDETTVILAVYQGSEKIGTLEVTVSGGAGSKAVTISVAGTYTYRADPDTLDPTWNMSKFKDAGNTTVEAT